MPQKRTSGDSNGGPGRARLHGRAKALALLIALGSFAIAQSSGDSTVIDEPVGLAAFGVSAGFPAYQAYALNASMQYRYVGLAARTTWTSAAGVYGSLALRGYPPIAGSPVPVFLEAGMGVHRAGLTSFAAAGAHVPLNQNVRLDFEVGAARVPFLDEQHIVPFLSVGTSYAFAFDASFALTERREQREEEARERRLAAGVNCGLEPQEDELPDAVAATVSHFLRDARATYGSLYSDLRYSYELVEKEIAGDRAYARIEYEGSVREIASGKRITASGSASADYRWNGCAWRRTSLSY